MPTNTHPQAPLAVELIEPTFDELPDELDVKSSYDSGWITISYREQTIGRYLPVHEFAEVDVHLVVDESGFTEDEPDEVTRCLIEALTTLRDRGFKICHEYAEEFGDGCFRQSLVFRKNPVSEEEMLQLVRVVLDASRYAIDLAAKQDAVQIGSD